eukprot:g4616.t1
MLPLLECDKTQPPEQKGTGPKKQDRNQQGSIENEGRGVPTVMQRAESPIGCEGSGTLFNRAASLLKSGLVEAAVLWLSTVSTACTGLRVASVKTERVDQMRTSTAIGTARANLGWVCNSMQEDLSASQRRRHVADGDNAATSGMQFRGERRRTPLGENIHKGRGLF